MYSIQPVYDINAQTTQVVLYKVITFNSLYSNHYEIYRGTMSECEALIESLN